MLPLILVLNKPVIYYQFDRNEFLGKEASHIDIEKLPGIIVNAQDKLEENWIIYKRNNLKSMRH